MIPNYENACPSDFEWVAGVQSGLTVKSVHGESCASWSIWYVSEKGYENSCHWLMFLFECKKTITKLPNEFDEGSFNFFTREEINKLQIPKSDHKLVWPFYDLRNSGFWGISADCSDADTPKIKIEANPN